MPESLKRDKSFQVPEVGTVPAVPEEPSVPEIVDVELLNLDEVDVRYRNQYDPGIWVSDPATGKFTAKGRHKFHQVCRKAGIGTDRPGQMAVVVSKDRSRLYMIAGLEHVDMVDLTYFRYEVRVNLIKVFTKLKRVLPEGTQEFYPVEIAEERVRVGGKSYQALTMSLTAAKIRWEKSEEEKEAERQKAAAKRVEKARKAAERKRLRMAGKGTQPAADEAKPAGGQPS